MKKAFLFFFAATLVLSGCKKDNTSGNNSCAISFTSIAGSYKLTKLVSAATGADITSSVDFCELSGITVLSADKSLVHTEFGSGCDNSGNSGDWDLTGNSIYVDFSGTYDHFTGTIVNNCTTLTVTSTNSTGAQEIATFTRQ